MLLYVDSQFASPYAMSVFVSLCEKNVPFDIETIDLSAKDHHRIEFSTTSITRRVPTLVFDGWALSESSAISEYIDETYPGTVLYPADPRLRAKARQVQAWLRSDLMAVRNERPTDVIFYGARKSALSVNALTDTEKLFSTAHALLHSRSDNLFGEWCIADLDLAIMLNRLIFHGDPVPSLLVAYAGRQWQRQSAQRCVTKRRPPAWTE